LGAAKTEAGRAYGFVKISVPEAGEPVTRESFSFRVDRDKRKRAEWRDGHYLLRSNLTGGDPAVLWARYVQRTQIEAVFRSLKSELGLRPIYHQLEHPRGCTHFGGVFGLFVASDVEAPIADPCTGSNPATVLEKLASIQMIDVHLPTVDGRRLILPRYTQPDTDVKILLDKLRLALPAQPPPRITSAKIEEPSLPVAG